MEERRSKISIFVDILRTIQNKQKAKPTHILYGANLSHPRMVKYLESLTADGFVERVVEGGRTYYVITNKGREFVSEFKKIKQFSDAFGIEI